MDIPRPIFDRQIGEISLRDIFEKDDDDEYIHFDATEDRRTSRKKYRIALHQRFNKWSHKAKETIIESIFLNYIIGSLSLSQHVDREHIGNFYYDIEDGQSRLTVIQEYIEDEFPFKGKVFSELTDSQKNRFMNYKFPKEITTVSRTRGDTAEIKDHYYENFDRINRGKELKDNDKYWCRKDKPMVKFAIDLINRFNGNSEYAFMKTDKFGVMKDGKENRDVLERIVTMIGGILYEKYKKSFDRQMKVFGKDMTQDKKNEVANFIEFYRHIYNEMLAIQPKESGEKYFSNFNNPGKFLGLIIMDYTNERVDDDGDNVTLEEKKDMWVNMLNIDRVSDNFMMGKQTLWMMDFTDGDRKNQEVSNLSKRLERVVQFYNDKMDVSVRYSVEYTEL